MEVRNKIAGVSFVTGEKIVFSNHACDPQYVLIKRTWGERLFTRPWNPRRKYKQILKSLNPQMYRFTPPGGETMIVAHPTFLEELCNLTTA